MAKYKIEYDREACIGAGSCIDACGKNWQMGDDNKANVITTDIEEADLECNKAAAESCPVGAIHIVDTETGEKLV